MDRKNIYFIGICGTGMAATAGLMQSLGHRVWGSDQGVYPPMDRLLAELKIDVLSPYAAEHLDHPEIDLVVVGNTVSKNQCEVAALMSKGLPYTSFASLLGEHLLNERRSVVVSGTHGKTTTTAMLAFCLDSLGFEPGYMIGGVPSCLPRGFAPGKAAGLFVIEGDEYDTAFFDKRSKFLHYRPEFLLLNNLEHDHVDIFPDFEALRQTFRDLIRKVPPANIVANIDSPEVRRLIDEEGLEVCRVAGLGESAAGVRVGSVSFGDGVWRIVIESEVFGELEIRNSTCGGLHNAANFAQVIGVLGLLGVRDGKQVAEILGKFRNVKRRLELKHTYDDIRIYEDFAHHPTAVATVLRGYKQAHPDRRLVVAFEPRNASSRRRVFQAEYSQAFGLADLACIAPPYPDARISPEERFDSNEVAAAVPGGRGRSFETMDALKSFVIRELRPGDSLLCMSCGSFDGLLDDLELVLR